jgi:hypothetical protein
MRVFGNLTNRIIETVKPAKPEVGMGATIIYFSDRTAATIVEVSENGKTIKVQADKAIRTDSNGQSDSQDYRYERNPKGKIETATLRKNGTFVIQGKAMRNGTIVRVGERDEYYDYSF